MSSGGTRGGQEKEPRLGHDRRAPTGEPGSIWHRQDEQEIWERGRRRREGRDKGNSWKERLRKIWPFGRRVPHG